MNSNLFQKIYSENKVPVAKTNIAGEYLDVNQAYEELIGYSLAELKRLTYTDVTPKKWHSIELENVLKNVFITGNMAYDKEYTHKSGEIIPIKANVFLIKNEQGLESGMWGTFEKV